MRSLLYSLLLVAATLPVLVYGQGKVYSPLVNIPGNGANGFEEYISFLYGASISVAALLAVVKIIIAGAKYMMSDVITNKGEALSDIQGAILGLLLILGAVIILEFINPQLIKRDIKFEPIADAAKINPRNSVAPLTDQAANDAAARAGAAGAVQGGCNVLTESDQGDRILRVLDMSGCVGDTSSYLAYFQQECSKDGGTPAVAPIVGKAAACSVPKPGVVKSNYGTETQKKDVTTITLTRADAAYQASEFKTACEEEKYGEYSIRNGPTGTFANATVTCKIPAIITYPVNASGFTDFDLFTADCTAHKGVFTKANYFWRLFGYTNICVIK